MTFLRFPLGLTASLLAGLFAGAASAPSAFAGSAPVAPPPPSAQDVVGAAVGVPGAQGCVGLRPCGASVAAPGACRAADPWRFSLSLPVWVPSLRGSLASGDVEVDAGDTSDSWSPLGWVEDVDLADTAGSLEFFFVGGFEARKGRWALGFELEHADLSASLDWKVSDDSVDGEFSATIGRLWARYEAGRHALGGRGPTLAWGPLLGARFFAVSASAKGALVDFDRSAWWLEPTVGLHLSLCFRCGLVLRVTADVGGTVTRADLPWAATAELLWPLSRRWTVAAGWGWHDLRYDVGLATDRFALDLSLAGPRLALSYSF